NSHQFYSIRIKSSNPTSNGMALLKSSDKFRVFILVIALGFARHQVLAANSMTCEDSFSPTENPQVYSCMGKQGTQSCQLNSCVVSKNQPWASATFKNCGVYSLAVTGRVGRGGRGGRGRETTGAEIPGDPRFTVQPQSYTKFPGGLAVLDRDPGKGWYTCLVADNAINAQRASQYLSASNQLVTRNLINLFSI
ncbi:hypothetical protein MJO29_011101, partial [Puccinia striiformis f. sp. tritici]